jgi:hypothetical protein
VIEIALSLVVLTLFSYHAWRVIGFRRRTGSTAALRESIIAMMMLAGAVAVVVVDATAETSLSLDAGRTVLTVMRGVMLVCGFALLATWRRDR